MGVDCYSLQKEDKESKGVNFHNNWWWWRPLWDYVCDRCSDIITEEQHKSGHYNCGDLLTQEQTQAVSKRLQELLVNGDVKAFEGIHNAKEYGGEKAKEIGAEYPFNEENVKDFIEFLEKANGMAIW